MNAPELIRKKRDGGKLSREEIGFLINGYLDGSIAEYQMSAMLMAIFFKGMDFEETSFLTDFILHSGKVLEFPEIKGLKVDKHSTGGVGDKVSIILAPMVAACGIPVPMVSGRALGHTGGTLDKLESITGFRVILNESEVRSILASVGMVMVGQTSEIAPADKRLYALRDVTSTVDSIPLISASIMSKKLAEGIDALVLDVKTGLGAIMPTMEESERLAKSLIGIGSQFNKNVVAFITNMDEPLGFAVGNWLEIVECIDCLHGKDVPDLMEVTYALGGAMVMLGGGAKTMQEGIEKCHAAINDGRAWTKFLEMVRSQGGDVSLVENPDRYPKSKFTKEVRATSDGWVTGINALEVGFGGNILGVGRLRVEDPIDPKAGVYFHKKIGDAVKAGDLVAVCYSDDQAKLASGSARIEGAFSYAMERKAPAPLIYSVLDKNGKKAWPFAN